MARVVARAYHERHRVIREAPLRRGCVHGFRFVQRQRHLLHVTHHADNRVQRSAADAQTLADRISSRKSALRHRLADQCNERGTSVVALAEQPAPPQRDAHHLEIARTHRVTKRPSKLAGVVRRNGIKLNTVHVEVTAKRQLAR